MSDKREANFKRRQYYIDKKFQRRFIMQFLLIILVGGLLSVGLTMLTSQDTLTSSYDGTRLAIEKTSVAIMPSVIVTNIITTCVISIIAAVVMLLVSHKIAGPMFRFESDLKVIAEGDLQKKIQIRNGDQFVGMVKNLNEMVESLNTKMTEIQQDLDMLTHSASGQNLPQSFIDEIGECRRKIDTQFKL